MLSSCGHKAPLARCLDLRGKKKNRQNTQQSKHGVDKPLISPPSSTLRTAHAVRVHLNCPVKMQGTTLKCRDLDSPSKLCSLLRGMKQAYENNENCMEYARHAHGLANNLAVATEISYDLQSGSYVKYALAEEGITQEWCSHLAALVAPYLPPNGTILEIGAGEATTLAGVLAALPARPSQAAGFDISWSRCAHGRQWLKTMNQQADLVVADLFHIPFADNSVDVVYTSHSLEPNGGREEEALKELLRVARRAVVLVEPIYELATPDAQARMAHHGYVRDLKATAETLDCIIDEYRLLGPLGRVNPLNPSGVIVMKKKNNGSLASTGRMVWRCPLTNSEMIKKGDGFFSPTTGIAYASLDGIPLLTRNHAVLASSFGTVT